MTGKTKSNKEKKTPAEEITEATDASESKNKANKEENTSKKCDCEETLKQLQRLQAEFDNYRKRVENDQKLASERGREQAIKEILPVVDALEQAHKHSGKSTPEQMASGLTHIHTQLTSLLSSWDVQQIPTEGIADSKLHEVYLTDTNTNKPAGTILDTLQTGYTRKGTVLRTAKIKAARS